LGKYIEFIDENGWEYVRRLNCSGAVAVLVYDVDTEEYIMVEQYRHPVKERILEFPAGLIDLGETPLQAAIRELHEETGIVASEDNLINLGTIFSGIGITDEKIYLYAFEMGKSTVISEPKLQGAEIDSNLKTLRVNEERLYHLKDTKVLCIYARYKAYVDKGIRF
jgi:ADP-ribose pyrophosphatase